MLAPNLTVTDLSFNRNQENLSASTGARIQLKQPKEKHDEPQPVTHIEANHGYKVNSGLNVAVNGNSKVYAHSL